MKNAALLILIILIQFNCLHQELAKVSFENEEFTDYYKSKLVTNSKEEIRSLKSLLIFNTISSQVNKDFKAPSCQFIINNDSLEVYFENKLITSLNDADSPLNLQNSDGHTSYSFSGYFTSDNLTEVFIFSQMKKLSSKKSTIKIHEFNKEEKVGHFFEYEEGNLKMKGYFKLLDHTRVDTFSTIDYDTYEESFEIRKFDYTWYKDGNWQYFATDGSILKTEDFGNRQIKLPQPFKFRF